MVDKGLAWRDSQLSVNGTSDTIQGMQTPLGSHAVKLQFYK